MRIRKEISKWSFRTFTKLAIILLVLFNAFTLFAAYLDSSISDINQTHYWVMSVSYPILLASIFTNAFRSGALFINDYYSITDFETKLKHKILQESMAVESETERQIIYQPTHWFTKLFKAWSGSEKLSVHFGDEIVLRGSLKRISNLEDILTWNRDFKLNAPAHKP